MNLKAFRLRRKVALQWVLVLPFVVLLVGTVGLVGYLSLQSGQQAVDRLSHRLVDEVSARIRDRLNVYLQTADQNSRNAQSTLSPQVLSPRISQFLHELNFSPSGQVFVIERSGNLIATSNLEPTVGNVSPNQPVDKIPATASQNALIRAAAQQLKTRWANLDQIQGKQHFHFIHRDGQEHHIQVFPYQMGADFDWLIVVVMPVSDFTNQIQANTYKTIFFCFMALGVSILLGLLMAHWISQPIRHLATVSQRLATGVWQDSLETESWIAEIDLLSQSFQKTTEQLHQVFDRIQTALAESEEKFTKVFRFSPDPVAITTLEGRYVEVNDSFLKAIDRTREEVINQTALELQIINPQESALIEQQFNTYGRLHGFEFSYYTKSGIHKTALLSLDFIELDSQLHLLAVLKDISDRKQTEAALRESEERFRKVFEQAGLGITLCDVASGRFLRVNHRFCEMLNYTEAELLDRTWQEVTHPEDFSQLTTEDIYRLANKYASFSCEKRYIRKDGSLQWASLSLSLVCDSQGVPIYDICIVGDIQARKQAEAALQQSEARNRAILAAIPDLMFLVNPNGIYVAVIRTTIECDLLPPTANPVGQHLTELVPLDIAARHLRAIQQVFATGEMVRYEQQVHLRDRWQHEEVRVVPCGENAMFIIRDITERVRLDQMKAEFISVVSHELRTPLTSMQAALSLLHEQIVDPGSDDGQTIIKIASDGVDRLVRLVNDILDLERLESGKMRIEPQLCEVQDLIHGAVEQMQEMANQAGIAFQITVPGQPIQVDPDRIVQVLTNLLSNAIKFSSNGSTVRIEVKAWDGNVVAAPPLPSSFAWRSLHFIVQDEGRGIPADRLDSIFERFQQVDASDSRQKGGTGLGLAICRSIIQQHGGQIWAESVLDQGTTFHFILPIMPLG